MHFIQWVILIPLRILGVLRRNSCYADVRFLMCYSGILGVLEWGACVEDLGVPGVSGYWLCEAMKSMVYWEIVNVLA